MYQGMLAEEGVDCMVKNDRLSGAIGEIPFVECYPELWVIDDEIYPRARLLLDGWLTRDDAVDEGPWICSNCGEPSAQQFAACWKCSQTRN